MKTTESLALILIVGLCATTVGLAFHGCADPPLLESRFNWRRGFPLRPTTPAVSSNGLFLLLDSSRTGNGDIYRLDRNLATWRRLTESDALEFHPVLSRDDFQVAYTRETAGYQHLWTMDVDGTHQKQVTHGQVIDLARCFSPNGGSLLFIRTSWFKRAFRPQRELFEVELAGPNAGRVTRLGDACAMSPDRSTLLSVEYLEDGKPQIWSRQRAGSDRKRLGDGASPSFSPDGRRIVYLHQRFDYETRVMVMNADGSKPEELPSPKGPKTEPEFCLGGKAIVFRIERTERYPTQGTYLVTLDPRSVHRLPETEQGGRPDF